MTDFRQFENDVLLALYREWEGGNTMVSLAKALQAANIDWKEGWLVRVHDSLKSKGLLDGPQNRRVEQMTAGSLTPAGLQHVEDNILPASSNDNEPESGENQKIDSSAWTGLPARFKLTEKLRTDIVNQLGRAEIALKDGAFSQEQSSQAHAYIVAARAMLEAPEPDPEMAWTIVNRASQIAGIASLFVSIIALFTAAF